MLTLIENVYAVLNDDRGADLDRTDILIEDDHIAAIGQDLRSTVNERSNALQVIDGRHSIAIPGLVNAHLHSNESFEQGMSERMPLELWRLRTYPPFGVPPLTEEDYYLRALMSGIISIRCGVTTVQDDVLNMACTPCSVDGACRAYRDLGLRAWVTTSVGDRSFAASHSFVDSAQAAHLGNAIGGTHPVSTPAQIELFERNHSRWHGSEQGRIRINIGPRGPQRCTDELLRLVIAASERHSCAIHTHVLETRAQAVTAQRDYGRSMIAHLSDIGFLGPRLTINHGIWLTDQDIELLARHYCSVTHNPLSNLKIGSGICRVRDLASAGVNIALGTDGLATSDTADMIAVLRSATMLHTVTDPDFDRWVSAREAFRMADARRRDERPDGCRSWRACRRPEGRHGSARSPALVLPAAPRSGRATRLLRLAGCRPHCDRGRPDRDAGRHCADGRRGLTGRSDRSRRALAPRHQAARDRCG
jgi:5-methylthioadenosine/S-adenosylhomocysteine deaminase